MAVTDDMDYQHLKDEEIENPQDLKDKEIQRLQERLEEYKNPKNVAIIGPLGVGKSSVIASFSSKCWRERTKVGFSDEEKDQATHHLIKITKDEYLVSEDKKKYPYPTLIDMQGFIDECSEKVMEQLRYVLFGMIEDEHKLLDDMKIYTDEGVKGIREAYLTKQETLKVDCVIFVASAASDLPLNLMEAVKQVATKEKRVIPVFGVLTKQDRCNDNLEERNSRKKEFCSKLGLSENRFLLCTNYCDDYDKEKGYSRCNRIYPELDVPILNFMRQVCDAGIKVIQNDAIPEGPQTATPQPQQDPHTAAANRSVHFIFNGLRFGVICVIGFALIKYFRLKLK